MVPSLQGAKVRQLNEIDKLLSEITSKAENLTKDLIWLLAFQFDGVIWGKKNGERWHLSGDVFKEYSPKLNKENLLEMRIFNKEKEILVWRSNADLKAREIIHNHSGEEHQNVHLCPKFETYLIRGDRLLESKNGFSLLSDPTGCRIIVPIECSENDFKNNRYPLKIKFCHYFDTDNENGMVRIIATRLVEISKK